jgi:homoserine dehydrogenase
MSRKKLTIGLFGLGCVGFGLYEVLGKTPGLKASIKRICVKDPSKPRPIPATQLTFNPNEILDDPEINTVVELIDDAQAAYYLVKTALQKGKAVVTANKKMIAEHFEELIHLQQKYNAPLLYEAACCASIPIIRNLEEYYDTDLLESIEGIVNGSSNFILTKTSEEAIPFQQALSQAQHLGFAESNPYLDVSGLDAKYKLVLLLTHAFGLIVNPASVFHLGIDRLSEVEFSYAKEKGLKIKLIALAEKNSDGTINAFVLPKFISRRDKLYEVNDVFNGVKTKSHFSDTQFFMGKGAGAYPTASAVLSDISALTYDYRYEYKKRNHEERLQCDQKIYLKVFLRHHPKDRVHLNYYFDHLQESYLNPTTGYIIGRVSLQQLKEINRLYGEAVSVVWMEDAYVPNATPLEALGYELA